MSQPFWYKEPSVLFGADTWYMFVPQPNMTVRAALNAVVRFAVYLSVLLTLTTMKPMYLLLIPIVMGASILLEAGFPEVKKMTENFVSGPVVSSYQGTDVRLPTPDNPFMNAPLTDILDNPNRPPAPADITTKEVREKINAAFAQTSNIYMDTSDVFDLVQAQRNFHTVPEDDHAGLLKFLRGSAPTGKELSEGYVVARGTMTELPNTGVTSPPGGTTPS